jgi:DNA invertase Pin-like site-specific DNA recombinase
MKVVDIYIRVSTDEQADKGFSQRDQEDRLVRYCERNGLHIRKTMFEDHSAKTFNRPQWARYLSELKKQKGKGVDFILFTKWDRFSRNTGDAYQMISVLRSFEIEPQAIEQPLNLEIPESKIMLAVYLSTPEVENDRRALNVTQGMRRARKEGKYMGVAPRGYDNKTREDGSKHIVINKEEAYYIKWIFKSISEGIFVPDQIRKLANEKGFEISRMSFYRAIRNPVYCGLIVVKAYKDEESQLVKGLHEAIISEALFYDVQDIINGRKKVLRVQAVKINECLPLQGLLDCASCKRHLTGSASKGRRGGYYYYYHAQAVYGCGCRFRADNVHEEILKDLRRYIPLPGMNQLYKTVLLDVYKNYSGGVKDERRLIADQIGAINLKLSNARELLFDGKLDSDDFAIMKKESEERIRRLEAALTEAKLQKSNTQSIDNMLLKALEALSRIENIYSDGDVLTKRRVLGSIYREKWEIDKNGYRTPKLNVAASLIYQINKTLAHKKTGKIASHCDLSRSVLRAGIEPFL